MLYDSIDKLIGNTPTLKFNGITALDGEKRLFGKIEYFNPSGSIKDRAALYMLNDALEKSLINDNSTIIEATSGNTGIALAMLCASKGLKLILTMPESMSIERRKILSVYGAELVLTPRELGMTGAVNKAKELNETIPDSFIPSQFTNTANPRAHFEMTAKEIEKDVKDLSAIVIGIGSAGTFNGIASYFRAKATKVKIIAVEPAGSPLLSKGVAGKHDLQGIGANFVPVFADKDLMDEIISVTDEDAYKYARLLASKEGILCGITSGAAVCAAVKVSDKIKGNILSILPDTGMRYLSTKMYE